MTQRPLFPIPQSSIVTITSVSEDVSNIELSSLSDDDVKNIVGFFLAMQGGLGTFRFEYNGTIHDTCRFESDTGPAITNAPAPHSCTIPIHILHHQ